MKSKNRKLILFFTYRYSLQIWDSVGILNRDIQLYSELSKYGFQTTFITYGRENEIQFLPSDCNFNVLTRPYRLSNFWYSVLSPIIYGKEINECAYIKTHQVQGSISGVIAKILYKKPYIARCGYLKSVFALFENEKWFNRFRFTLEEFLAFRFADIVCVTNEAEAKLASQKYHVPFDKFQISPNWIDTQVFSPFGKKDDTFTICFVGRFVKKKGPDILLEAIKGLEKIKLIMIGNGPMKDELVKQSIENHLDIEFYDQLPNEEIPKHLNRSKVYVLPTHHEGCPKTLLEAMSCGLPVISTDGYGVNEFFEDGVHGIKVKFGDVEALHNAIVRLINEPDLAKSLGDNARRLIIENYSIEKAVQREIYILEKLLSAKPSNK